MVLFPQRVIYRLLLSFFSLEDDEKQKSVFRGMDAKEKEIFTLINNHRRQYDLPVLETSINLAYVAHTHAVDLSENNLDVYGDNEHS
ncbi:unnamed protein product [Rotaria sp. Silwood1]|nr:unnamed protein product [Rotaria sp. Silwood1]